MPLQATSKHNTAYASDTFHLSNNFCSPSSYNQYLKTFMMDFYVGVIKLVDKALKKVDTSVRGIMATEIHKHLHICKESATKFLGREEEMYKVSEPST